MELLFSAGKIALGVAIGLPLLVYVLQDRILFQTRPLTEAQRVDAGKGFRSTREILIQAKDGTRLQAWHVDAGAGAPLVLYFGGNAEDVSWMISDAEQKVPGESWLLVSYRGYGGSEGSPSEASLTADALEWHDYAVKTLKPSRVFAFGRSLGSGVAVALAAERPLAGVVLVTPYDSLVEVAGRIYPYLPVGLLMKHRFDSIARAPKISASLLCLAAEQDEVIPPVHAKRLYDAWAGPKQWVALPGAGHNSTDGVPAFWTEIRKFLGNRHGTA